MAVYPTHRYSNEAERVNEDLYDDFKSEKLRLFNPFSPHDALKHRFTSLKTYLIFQQLGF